jgi:hypothetical protein
VTPLTSQIDRKQRFFSVTDLHFPHWERIDDPLGETILDGELVIDIDPKTHVVGMLVLSAIPLVDEWRGRR